MAIGIARLKFPTLVFESIQVL